MHIGSRGNPNANILIVGEAFDVTEEREMSPFIGTLGKETERILQEAGIDPDACHYTAVVKKAAPRNNLTKFFIDNGTAKEMKLTPYRDLYPDEIVLDGIALLEQLIEDLQPKLIIAMGNLALWALAKAGDYKITRSFKPNKWSASYRMPTGIVSYRGSMLRSRVNDIPLLPTFHPSACQVNYPWRYLLVQDLRTRVKLALQDKWDDPERNFVIRPTFEVVMSTLNAVLLRAELASAPILVSCDIETSQRFIECIGFAWSKEEAICIPIMCSDKWEGYWSAYEELEIMLLIKRLLEHRNIAVVGQNFFYDYQYFWYYYGIKANYRQDTMLAHHVCFPGTSMGLDYISSLYCSFHRYWKDDGKEAAKEHNDEQRWIYNCRDCVVTFEAIQELWKVIKHYNLQRQYSIQMVRANSAIRMMVKGIRIDEKRRGEERIVHMQSAQEIENRLETMMPESVWPRPAKKAPWYRSNQQLGQILYDVLGEAEIKDRKTFSRTTNDEALAKIGARNPLMRALTSLLQQYRSLDVFGDFINMKVGQDKRMRANFSPTTETFRYRSSADVFGYGRNLQNLPKGQED